MLPKQIYTIAHALGRPSLLFFALPWPMLLLVMGTLAQRNLGLYAAEKRFFSSFFLWLGPVPLPGMYLVLAVIGVSLVAKLLLKSPWTRATAGTVVTHIGAMLLLVGAVFTAVASAEGFMALEQGKQVRSVSDYHARELVVEKNGKTLVRIPQEQLAKGTRITHGAMPFSLTVRESCRHCMPQKRTGDGANYRGVAQKLALIAAAVRKEDEENQFGVMFEVHGAGTAQDGIYLAYEMVPHHPAVEVGQDAYRVIARKVERQLPFTVRLDAFRKITYPGSQIAREYESVVTVFDGALQWQTAIRMNEPLRYRGYTLYQSSFLQQGDEQVSVLTVVENAGRVFPYISSIVMCVGLLMHLVMRWRVRQRRISA